MRATLIFSIFVSGCLDQSEVPESLSPPQVLRLATTTSTQDSGLLEHLLPDFERQYNCRVDVIAVGTGAALKLGESGDVDVLIVHDPSSERAFMEAGHGIHHEEFMANSFVILGPREDPANIRGKSPPEALDRLASTEATFISRGDESGTHKREMALWSQAGGLSVWRNYLESGQGMGSTLMMADELQGYLLIDEGTYLRFRERIELVPLITNSPLLLNPYSVIVVDPEKHANIKALLAEKFAKFLIDRETQNKIAEFRIAGQPLFQPTILDKK